MSSGRIIELKRAILVTIINMMKVLLKHRI